MTAMRLRLSSKTGMKDREKGGCTLDSFLGFQCTGAVVHSREHEPPGSISLAKVCARRVVGKPGGSAQCSGQTPSKRSRERHGKARRFKQARVAAPGWREILPDDPLRELASRLLDVYTLRPSESLQLAAALTWCQQQPAQRRFISGDQRLCDAAEAAGFVVIALVRPGT